jgi:hypothetical protein
MTGEGTCPFEQFFKLRIASEMHAEAIGGESFELAATRGWRTEN